MLLIVLGLYCLIKISSRQCRHILKTQHRVVRQYLVLQYLTQDKMLMFNIYLIRVLENIQPHISPGLQGDISSTENELMRD